MCGITDVDRGICEAPRGLANPGFQAAMQSRMERIARLQGKDYVRSEMWDDVAEGLRQGAGRDGSSIARAMLEGRRQFENDEERLLYLRFTLQMELEGDQRNGYYSGTAKNPNRIASAMVDYEMSAMRSSAEQVAPVPPGRSYSQPAPAVRSSLKPPTAPVQLDVRGLTSDWGEQAARNDRNEYEAFLVEVALLNAEEEARERKAIVYSGAYTADPYQTYIGGPFESMVSEGRPFVPLVVSLVLDLTPIVGQLKAITEGIVGQDLITGRKLEGWERGLGILLALIPEARGVFKTGRAGLRVLAGAAKGERSADEVYRIAKVASRMSEADVRAATKITSGTPAHLTEFEKVAGKLEEMTAPKSKGYRVAHGTIEDGRTISKGVASSPIKVGAAAPGRVIKATKTAEQIVERLTKAGIIAKAIAAMERVGTNVTEDVARLLASSDSKAGAFVNLFHDCPGFENVLKDAIGGGNKKKGALFVMEFVTDTANKIDPKFVSFELPVGKTRAIMRGGVVRDVAARYTDLVITGGDRVLNYEFKAYGKTAVAQMFENRAKVLQLVKDVKMLGRDTIRWVFDSRDVSREFVHKQFERAIKSDVLLAREFRDANKLQAALDDLIVMYPPVPKLPAIPASAPVKAADAAEEREKARQ